MHGSADIRVLTLDHRRTAEWDAFVLAHEDGSFFHLAGWREAIARAFGHQGHYLFAERDGVILGVLPLIHMRSRLFGNSLVSNAFCVYGGPLARTPEALAALDREAVALAGKLGVGHLEYRLRRPLFDDRIRESDLHVTFRKSISGDDDANMKAIPRKQRAMVRKAIGFDLRSVLDAGPERLYDVYAESLRNLGTPVFARAWLEILHEVFGEACESLVIEHEGRPVAAVMSFYFRDEVLPYYGGSVPAARALAGNDFMYWEVMRRAAGRGARVFDFGRSKSGTGAFAFKKNWGFSPEPLHYEYRLGTATEVPRNNPLNPKYRLAIALWQKLPLGLANRLGPPIARGLG